MEIMNILTRITCGLICETLGIDEKVIDENWDEIWTIANEGTEKDLEDYFRKIL